MKFNNPEGSYDGTGSREINLPGGDYGYVH